MERRARGPRGGTRGVSPILASAVLILATLITGAVLYAAVRGRVAGFSSNAGLRVRSADLVTVTGGSRLSITVKNTGTVDIDNVVVEVMENSTPAAIELGPVPSGRSASASEDLSASVPGGKTLPITVIAYDSNGGSILELTVTVTARG